MMRSYVILAFGFLISKNRFIWFLLIGAVCCSPFRSKELVPLPITAARGSLDSLQAHSIFKSMQHLPNETQLAIGFIVGDSNRYCGIIRRNDSLQYVQNSSSIFEIGSVTKTFTATMLAKLVYDGKVDLNEPIKNILPVQLHQSALNGKEVTLLHLANHTSGFPKEPDNISTDWATPASPYSTYDTTKLYDYLSNRLTLQSTPGEKRSYSNLGGGLLGHLLTLITGRSYEELLMESICMPLAMERTFVTFDSTRRQHLVAGRDPQGNVVPNWELNVLAGGGGIKSTVEDLAKYLRAQMTDTTYFFLTQRPTIQYTEHNTAGLGWAWYTNGNKKFVDATGGTGGYSSIVIFERSTKTAIILLTNVSALAGKGDYVEKLGIELHDSLQRDSGRGCSRHLDTLQGRVVAGSPIPEDALMSGLEQHHVPGVSIAVVHRGRIDWAKGYGVLARGKSDRVDTTTLFQAASISKPVSAVAALRMVDMGMLALDEDVNLRLSSWNVPRNEFTRKEPVTLRRLLSHSAGLTMHGVPEFWADDELPTLVQILDGDCPAATDSVRAVYEPGTKFQYSGGGYIVLQLLMTDVSRRAFSSLADELVLRPAGMVSSTFEQPLPQNLRSRAAVGHLANGAPLKGSWHTLPEQAAGGLWTTPRDLASFMIELWRSYHGLSNTLLPKPLAREMLTRQIDDFGLGLSLPSVGVFRFQHSGGNAGYRCFMVLSIDDPEGVVIMTNGDSGEPLIWEVFKVIGHAYGWLVE